MPAPDSLRIRTFSTSAGRSGRARATRSRTSRYATFMSMSLSKISDRLARSARDVAESSSSPGVVDSACSSGRVMRSSTSCAVAFA